MLRLEGLTVDYETAKGPVRAVDSVTLNVRKNEVFALIGESGCGKTTAALSPLGLLPSAKLSGAVWFAGENLLEMKSAEIRRLLGARIGVVFQNPYSAFDPLYKIGAQIAEAARVKRSRAAEMLVAVGLKATDGDYCPHELSGGMLQRAQLAIALCRGPELVIADEATSSLDTASQAGILELIARLKREKELTVLLITHDLSVVAAMANTVAVMKDGKIVETGPAKETLAAPKHLFTQELLNSKLTRKEG